MRVAAVASSAALRAAAHAWVHRIRDVGGLLLMCHGMDIDDAFNKYIEGLKPQIRRGGLMRTLLRRKEMTDYYFPLNPLRGTSLAEMRVYNDAVYELVDFEGHADITDGGMPAL